VPQSPGPKELHIDFAGKSVKTPYRTDRLPIQNSSSDDEQLIMQGTDLKFAWSAIVNRKSGAAVLVEQAAAEREQILDLQVRDNERALELENVRYRPGSTDLRTVTQQQLAVYASRSSLLRVRADRALSRVSRYLPLRGGFSRDVG
jgi:hypothetical protein